MGVQSNYAHMFRVRVPYCQIMSIFIAPRESLRMADSFFASFFSFVAPYLLWKVSFFIFNESSVPNFSWTTKLENWLVSVVVALIQVTVQAEFEAGLWKGSAKVWLYQLTFTTFIT